MFQSEDALLRRMAAGDEDALEELVDRWYPRIYAYALRTTGREQDAQDVTQETFLALLRHRKSFVRKNFQSWLFTIAHHKCVDLFRLQGRLAAAPEELERLSDPDSSGQVLDRAVLEQALERLPPLQREAAVLHYFHGFTPREIAAMTDSPLSTVRWRLTAARRAMAEMLKEDGYG